MLFVPKEVVHHFDVRGVGIERIELGQLRAAKEGFDPDSRADWAVFQNGDFGVFKCADIVSESCEDMPPGIQLPLVADNGTSRGGQKFAGGADVVN